jgi:hypothetical protein
VSKPLVTLVACFLKALDNFAVPHVPHCVGIDRWRASYENVVQLAAVHDLVCFTCVLLVSAVSEISVELVKRIDNEFALKMFPLN